MRILKRCVLPFFLLDFCRSFFIRFIFLFLVHFIRKRKRGGDVKGDLDPCEAPVPLTDGRSRDFHTRTHGRTHARRTHIHILVLRAAPPLLSLPNSPFKGVFCIRARARVCVNVLLICFILSYPTSHLK